MAQRLLKYSIPPHAEFTLDMPAEARILSVQTQGQRNARIWALVDTQSPVSRRKFCLLATGDTLSQADDRCLEYVGTFQAEAGLRVYHLFEIFGSAPLTKEGVILPLS